VRYKIQQRSVISVLPQQSIITQGHVKEIFKIQEDKLQERKNRLDQCLQKLNLQNSKTGQTGK
jgi:hypothetical protein